MSAVDNWFEEKQSAWLYRIVTRAEPDPVKSTLFAELADVAESQARIWQKQIERQGALLSVVAGVLAGAFSMAAGENVSMRSQRELFEYQIALEREELEEYPLEEQEELALIYKARGLTKQQADEVAAEIMKDREQALDTLAREELGLNPDELGSPWGAAGSSFVAFGVGGAVPLLPFLFGAGTSLLSAIVVVTGIALFGVGAALSLFTGKGAWWSGLRMVLIGGGAGLVTFVVGRLLGGGIVCLRGVYQASLSLVPSRLRAA